MSFIYKETILNTPGLVAYWKVDETSGSTAQATFGGVNGTRVGVISGSSPIVPENLTGVGATSVGFDGVNDYVSMGNNFDFPGKVPYTIELWIWPVITGGSSSFPTFLSNTQYASGTGGYEMYFDRPNLRWVWSRRGDNVTNYCYGPSGGIQDRVWVHLVIRYDPGLNQMAMWANGTLIGTATSSVNQSSTTSSFRLGSYAGGSDFFNGHLDEVAIYNIIVPMSTFKDHYQRGISSRFDGGSYACII